MDKQNSDVMIHMGLSLLTIALEIGADSIGKYDSLLEMVKDDLCRNLFAVSLFLHLFLFFFFLMKLIKNNVFFFPFNFVFLQNAATEH